MWSSRNSLSSIRTSNLKQKIIGSLIQIQTRQVLEFGNLFFKETSWSLKFQKTTKTTCSDWSNPRNFEERVLAIPLIQQQRKKKNWYFLVFSADNSLLDYVHRCKIKWFLKEYPELCLICNMRSRFIEKTFQFCWVNLT